MKSYVQISIRTRADTHDWPVGDAMIGALSSNSVLVPEQLSHNPDRYSNPRMDMSCFRECWASVAQLRVNGSMFEFHQDFCWRRKRLVRSSGCLQHKKVNVKGQVVPGSLDFEADWTESVDWAGLFREWCGIIPPQLGMLHVFSRLELDLIDRNGNFAIGSFGPALDPKVPGLGWAMFFGDEFSKQVDPLLIAESGFPLIRMGGGYLVCVTKDLGDVVGDYSGFAERRRHLESILPVGMFGR